MGSHLSAVAINAKHLTWHNCLGDQPATWWQADYTGLIPSWRGSMFPSRTRQFEYRFLFSACDDYAKISKHEFTECLIPHHGIPYNTTYDDRIHFTKKCSNRCIIMNLLVLTFSPLLLFECFCPFQNSCYNLIPK